MVHHARQHWLVFFIPLSVRAALFLLAFLVAVVCARSGVGVLLLLANAGIWFWAVHLHRKSSGCIVTARGVSVRSGPLRGMVVETDFEDLETLGVDQGPWGRFFGCGSVILKQRSGPEMVFRRIERPVEILRKLKEQADAWEPEKGRKGSGPVFFATARTIVR